MKGHQAAHQTPQAIEQSVTAWFDRQSHGRTETCADQRWLPRAVHSKAMDDQDMQEALRTAGGQQIRALQADLDAGNAGAEDRLLAGYAETAMHLGAQSFQAIRVAGRAVDADLDFVQAARNGTLQH